jgi:hypothetical protein
MPAAQRICSACRSELERDLADVPSLAGHLQLALARQVRMSDAVARGTETPLPYDARAGDAAILLHQTLAAWVAHLQAGAPIIAGPVCSTGCRHATCLHITLSCRPGPSTADHARWLLRHLPILLGKDLVEVACEQLTEAIRGARRVIDRPLDRVYAGPCDECGRDLYAQPGATITTCPTCVDAEGYHLGYGVQSRRDWMLAEIEEMRLPASDITRALTSLVRPIKPALLYTWVHRRRLVPVGTNAHGHALFRVGDVLDLMGNVPAVA